MRDLTPGLTLRSYRLEKRLGIGGDGDVWQAVDARGQRVALKARPVAAQGDEDRVRREFERLRTLRFPGVVRVLDAGADQGWVFFTMEIAEGEPFDRAVQRGASLAVRVQRAADAGAQLARALASIHRLGLAHRDVKPANLLVDDAGRLTVLDFGTARFRIAGDTSSAFMGTVAYMAPEQRLGLAHDHRVDLYALGVLLHEALSEVPAGRWKPGRPRSSLLLLGPEVPRALADLVDRLLRLDPVERPDATEAELLLQAVAEGAPLPAAPWPDPPAFAGDPSLLLETSAIVCGRPGSGRHRLVDEARWAWYRRGYRSIAGRAAAHRPWGALRDVLEALFAGRDGAARRELAGDDAPLLAAIWPDLPLPVAPARGASPAALAQGLGRVLGRAAPLAVVLHGLDDADAGTASVLPLLARELPEGLLLWATGRRPAPGLRQVEPAAWDARAAREVLPTLLPPGEWPAEAPGATPLEGVAAAWRLLARARGEDGPAHPLPPGLDRLTLLDEPFPAGVGRALVPGLDALVAAGHLRAAGPDGRLAFADPGTRRLAWAAQDRRPSLHALAAEAWAMETDAPDRVVQVARHAVRGGHPPPSVFDAAIRREVGRGNPAEVDRWLQLKDLLAPGPDDQTIGHARLFAAFELRRGAVDVGAIKALGRTAASAEEKARAGALLLAWEARRGDPGRALRQGAEWAGALEARQPAVASLMWKEVALVHLRQGSPHDAAVDAARALGLARQAAGDGPLEQPEVTAATTLSAALVYAGRLAEAESLGEDYAKRCASAGLSRGEGALLCNAAAAAHQRGARDRAAERAARVRAGWSQHRDPSVLASITLLEARLAVEGGDIPAARPLLDEALSLVQAVGQANLEDEARAVLLDLAVHAADRAEAARALSADAHGGPLDPFPAALARWLWLTGDIGAALRATDAPRRGFADRLLRAERGRLLLIAGRREEAGRVADALLRDALEDGMDELAAFARLVAGAASAAGDAAVAAPLALAARSRWAHLYLGALHLDAIRRQARGEAVGAVLRQLRDRARPLGHRLYEALAREDGW